MSDIYGKQDPKEGLVRVLVGTQLQPLKQTQKQQIRRKLLWRA